MRAKPILALYGVSNLCHVLREDRRYSQPALSKTKGNNDEDSLVRSASTKGHRQLHKLRGFSPGMSDVAALSEGLLVF